MDSRDIEPTEVNHDNLSFQEVKSFDDEHKAFAASRVQQFVYVPTKDIFFSTLDAHADTLEGDVKPPLVLVGNEGSGKSALLANWYARRLEHKHKEEFLFQHFVGCSTPSLQLSHTLLRLEKALNDFFQLHDMTVPDTEEDLRWSLNRFLAAAAKKYSPARIIIIIDGVHRLKNETGPDGALHWLPTELPACVRFIVSTVEYDRSKGVDSLHHRTFIELMRRNCPLLYMEPLSTSIRHSIIDAFMDQNLHVFDLTDNQQFKIASASATSQPMYLRSLLQSLRLSRTLTHYTVDNLLEMFLTCDTAHDLINRNLDICCSAIFSDTSTSDPNASKMFEIQGKILSMVYVSRNGLLIDEIKGLLNLITTGNVNNISPTAANIELPFDDLIFRKLLLVLQDFTMVVNDMYSFTHEIYREVVYDKYIGSKDLLIRWHNLLAKYFGHFPSSDRKIVVLPYHLEQAGSWTRVKNCLTEIEMFRLWWKPKYKSDLIKFWASLTRNPSNSNANGNTNTLASNNALITKNKRGNNISSLIMSDNINNDNVTNDHANKRPTYDIVDEYVKSLDEYRAAKNPSDEVVSDIVLEIADFLLEFAIAGHEKNADVPNNVHPIIPTDDLEKLGVPYIYIDETTGRSILKFPKLFNLFNRKQNSEDGGTASDIPTKALHEIPEHTTYYFSRWLWIQFPFVALGNCDTRFLEGKLISSEDSKHLKLNDLSILPINTNLGSTANTSKTLGTSKSGQEFKRSFSKELDTAVRLPQIKFHKKAKRSMRLIPGEDLDPLAPPVDEVTMKLMNLQDDIQAYRDECDFLGQLKTTLGNRIFQQKGQLIDLIRTEEATHNFDSDLADITKREQDSFKKMESVKNLNKNLKSLVIMCERHPASFPAVIEDLKNKVLQDEYILTEIKQRLWEQKFESQSHYNYFKQIQQLVTQGVEMQNQLLAYRAQAANNVNQQLLDDERKLKQAENSFLFNLADINKNTLHKNQALNLSKQKKSSIVGSSNKHHPKTWDEIWHVISTSTGITDPDIFFHRINNGKLLEDQMNLLKKHSENRLENLKRELINVENEEDDIRCSVSLIGGNSIKEQQKDLLRIQYEARHRKERAEGAEQLQQRVIAGLVHLGEMLGIQPREDETSVVNDLLRDIEAVLDTLLDEREKQVQQQGQPHSQSTMESFSRSVNGTNLLQNNPETHHRTPELDFIIAKFESPTVRLPSKLASKASSNNLTSINVDNNVVNNGTINNNIQSTSTMNNNNKIPNTSRVPASSAVVSGNEDNNSLDGDISEEEELGVDAPTWDRMYVKKQADILKRKKLKEINNLVNTAAAASVAEQGKSK